MKDIGGYVLEQDPDNACRWTHVGPSGRQFWWLEMPDGGGYAGMREADGSRPAERAVLGGPEGQREAAEFFAAHADLW